ncbi:DNA polymerase III subunit beta [Candidatus Falkowbacteria bacterium]|nr:MAG: DNA polymerase III subunit beta [Candidatus Falkowbacteria bacterium]
MKITSLQENLKSGLFFVGHIAGKNVNLPILNNVMIEAKDKNIKLITTDLEIGIVALVRGKIETDGVFTVDAKVLSEYVSLLPNKKIDINKKDTSLIIECDNHKTTIKGQAADEFPLIPKVEKKEYFKINSDDFKKALAQVIFAVSPSETRIELSGVLFDFNKDNLTIAATDSYRLAEKKIKVETNGSEKKRIIIPAKTLQEVIRILSAVKAEDLSEKEKKVEIYVSENQILFNFGNIELVSRLIEGQYPDYKQIVPVNKETEIKINKSELVRAVKAASIFSKTGINDINLDFPIGKNQAIISSASTQLGENKSDLAAQVTGKDNGIVVNFRYLLDGINNIDSEDVKIEIINNSTPCVLRPDKDDSYLYVIMPIKQ